MAQLPDTTRAHDQQNLPPQELTPRERRVSIMAGAVFVLFAVAMIASMVYVVTNHTSWKTFTGAQAADMVTTKGLLVEDLASCRDPHDADILVIDGYRFSLGGMTYTKSVILPDGRNAHLGYAYLNSSNTRTPPPTWECPRHPGGCLIDKTGAMLLVVDTPQNTAAASDMMPWVQRHPSHAAAWVVGVLLVIIGAIVITNHIASRLKTQAIKADGL